METVNNNNGFGTAVKVTGLSAGVGAIFYAGREIYRQKKIFKHPDEFITRVDAKVAKLNRFNTAFYRGTEEAAQLARENLEKWANGMKNFARNGKLNFKAIFKKAGGGALKIGILGLVIYGAVKLIKRCIKGGAKVAAEGVKEANE